MTPELVLQHSLLVLDQRLRERYFDDGFHTVPGYVGAAWLDRLRAVGAPWPACARRWRNERGLVPVVLTRW